MIRIRLALISAIPLLLPTAALAQVPRPPAAEPSRVQQNLHLEQGLPPVFSNGLVTLSDDNGKQKALSGGARFRLQGVDIRQNSALSGGDLKDIYAPFIGQEVNLATLNDIASRITARYRNEGYILSRAIVPPQRIKDGVVTFTIIEGYVNQVVVEGPLPPTPLLQSYADKIRSARPLSTATLERYLLLMQDLPGITARAVLQPSASMPGASDVIITMEQKHTDGAVNLDNRGTRYLGPVQGGVTYNFNNVLGVHERTQLRYITTSDPGELRFFQISHDEQIGSEGTRATVLATRTRTRPNYRLEAFDIDGFDTLYSANVQHPFLRSRQENFYGNASFDHRKTESSALGLPLYGDRLNVARMGAAYDVVDAITAVNRVAAQLSKGFGWADNVRPNLRSRANGKTDFWKATAQLSRLQPLSSAFNLYGAAQAQIASAALLSAEQFGIGGAQFGSAYDPSEITGDSGVAARAELQYNSAPVFDWLDSSQFYGFYDIGGVRNRHVQAGQRSRISLASLGVGTRFNLLERLSGSMELAKPLTKQVSANAPRNGNDTRVFFSLAYRF